MSLRKKEAIPTLVCSHPILPTEYYESIDDNIQRVKIAFHKTGRWRSVVAERKLISDRRSILDLSKWGIDVTSERSGISNYLAVCESQNETRIPRRQSIGLGWVNSEFSPYIENIKFDGEGNFDDVFNSVRAVGDYDTWLKYMIASRKRGGLARIVLAASFAAPLVGLLDGLPFFVHLWGGSGAGKTVALMAAASVWGNPATGKLVRSFSSTGVGMEVLAGFLRNLPVCLDELGTAKRDDEFDKIIYLLGEGQGKTRGRCEWRDAQYLLAHGNANKRGAPDNYNALWCWCKK